MSDITERVPPLVPPPEVSPQPSNDKKNLKFIFTHSDANIIRSDINRDVDVQAIMNAMKAIGIRTSLYCRLDEITYQSISFREEFNSDMYDDDIQEELSSKGYYLDEKIIIVKKHFRGDDKIVNYLNVLKDQGLYREGDSYWLEAFYDPLKIVLYTNGRDLDNGSLSVVRNPYYGNLKTLLVRISETLETKRKADQRFKANVLVQRLSEAGVQQLYDRASASESRGFIVDDRKLCFGYPLSKTASPQLSALVDFLLKTGTITPPYDTPVLIKVWLGVVPVDEVNVLFPDGKGILYDKQFRPVDDEVLKLSKALQEVNFSTHEQNEARKEIIKAKISAQRYSSPVQAVGGLPEKKNSAPAVLMSVQNNVVLPKDAVIALPISAAKSVELGLDKAGYVPVVESGPSSAKSSPLPSAKKLSLHELLDSITAPPQNGPLIQSGPSSAKSSGKQIDPAVIKDVVTTALSQAPKIPSPVSSRPLANIGHYQDGFELLASLGVLDQSAPSSAKSSPLSSLQSSPSSAKSLPMTAPQSGPSSSKTSIMSASSSYVDGQPIISFLALTDYLYGKVPQVQINAFKLLLDYLKSIGAKADTDDTKELTFGVFAFDKTALGMVQHVNKLFKEKKLKKASEDHYMSDDGKLVLVLNSKLSDILIPVNMATVHTPAVFIEIQERQGRPKGPSTEDVIGALFSDPVPAAEPPVLRPSNPAQTASQDNPFVDYDSGSIDAGDLFKSVSDNLVLVDLARQEREAQFQRYLDQQKIDSARLQTVLQQSPELGQLATSIVSESAATGDGLFEEATETHVSVEIEPVATETVVQATVLLERVQEVFDELNVVMPEVVRNGIIGQMSAPLSQALQIEGPLLPPFEGDMSTPAMINAPDYESLPDFSKGEGASSASHGACMEDLAPQNAAVARAMIALHKDGMYDVTTGDVVEYLRKHNFVRHYFAPPKKRTVPEELRNLGEHIFVMKYKNMDAMGPRPEGDSEEQILARQNWDAEAQRRAKVQLRELTKSVARALDYIVKTKCAKRTTYGRFRYKPTKKAN